MFESLPQSQQSTIAAATMVSGRIESLKDLSRKDGHTLLQAAKPAGRARTTSHIRHGVAGVGDKASAPSGRGKADLPVSDRP
jgi:hypothetical protein